MSASSNESITSASSSQSTMSSSTNPSTVSTSSNPVPIGRTASQAKIPGLDKSADMFYYLTEGLRDVEQQQYVSTAKFRTAIAMHLSQFRLGNTGLYVVFAPVTPERLIQIERFRDKHEKSLRFMYLNEGQALIVKITPDSTYEAAKWSFIGCFMFKISSRELDLELGCLGSSKALAADSSNEADGAWRPKARPGKTGWPTLVLECAAPKSLDRLRVEARWWFERSGGEVMIVILISMSEPERTLRIEKWELVDAPHTHITRADPGGSQSVPTMTHEVDIQGTVVTGAPLTIEFHKLFLREPLTGEKDIVFTLHDLQRYAQCVWNNLA